MKAGHDNLNELSEADVNKLSPNVGKFSRAGAIFGFSTGCLRAPIYCAMGRSTFPTLGK
jgi:hypothetical protein